MRTLAQLRKQIFPIPCGFCEGAKGDIDEIPVKKDEDKAVSFQSGFQEKCSHPQSSNGIFVTRKEFNGIGEIAVRESHYRQSGGYHTFNTGVVEAMSGYPNQGVLTYDDGEDLDLVESCVEKNAVDFVDDPTVINSYVKNPSEGSEAVERLCWRRAKYSYGLDKEYISFGANFSIRKLVPPGAAIEEDSLIALGYHMYCQGVGITLTPLKGVLEIVTPEGNSYSLDISNLGKEGIQIEQGVVILIEPTEVWPSELCGSGNYGMSFFVKKGTKITCTVTDAVDSKLLDADVYAYPIIRQVAGADIV